MKGVRLWEQLKTQARATPWWALKVSLALSPSNYTQKSESLSLWLSSSVVSSAFQWLPTPTHSTPAFLSRRVEGEWILELISFIFLSPPTQADPTLTKLRCPVSQVLMSPRVWLLSPSSGKMSPNWWRASVSDTFGGGDAPLIVWVDLLVQILGSLSGMFLRAPRWANRLHRPAFPLPN